MPNPELKGKSGLYKKSEWLQNKLLTSNHIEIRECASETFIISKLSMYANVLFNLVHDLYKVLID